MDKYVAYKHYDITCQQFHNMQVKYIVYAMQESLHWSRLGEKFTHK